MHCKVFQKWVNVIVFPEDIKLIDAIEVIQKYIEMEARNDRKLEITQETIEDEEKQGRYPSFLKGRVEGIKDCINVLEWEVWDKYEK